jgi:succinyl-CoA synthetase beta subunit
MKIHEYQAKELFGQYGINVPDATLAHTPEEVEAAAQAYGCTVAVKAQVHVGGRGKAGGIKVVHDAAAARQAGEAILGMDIKGITVKKVSVVESSAAIVKEAYLGIILDRAVKGISFICSAAGGVDIEEVAATTPEKILRFHTTDTTFPEAEARAVAGQLFEDDTTVEPVLQAMRGLFQLFVDKDASLAEINPLVLNDRGEVVALDGKINFDDNALFRQPEIVALRDMDEEDANEIEAKEKGLSFVQLDGDIGCMVNGAGLAMATMDMIQFYGGSPANFLDVGGSSNPEKVVHAFRLLTGNPKVKAILVNIFGGITRCDDIARGMLQAFEQIDITLPIVVRLSGTNAAEGMALLADTSLTTADSFGEAVQAVIAQAKGAA